MIKHGNRFKNLTNKKFNKLLVIKFAYMKATHSYWRCKCNCGNEKIIKGTSLLKNLTKSCGCLVKYKNQLKCSIKRGMIFGRLIVLKRIKSIKYKNCFEYLCQCSCGNQTIVLPGNLNRKTKSCGCLNKEMSSKRLTILRKTQFGINHPNWNHKLTKEERNLNKNRNLLPETYLWKQKIFNRDNYTCQLTGLKGKLCAHHIFNWAKYPKKRFDIDNGITLKENIHKLFQ